MGFFISTATILLLINSFTRVSSVQEADEPPQFTYTGTKGPTNWAKLDPKFSMCANGKWQSPINILASKAVVNKRLQPLVRSYTSTNNVTLVDNKFNIGIRYPDNSGGIVVYGKMYKLKQMHWHSPSEHRVDGKQFAAELHLVHTADDGNVSVIAILFAYGKPDPLVAKLQSKLSELDHHVKRHDEAPILLDPIHTEELRKRTHKYYRYIGSFTTPPCTPNIIWNILGKVRSISKKQVDALKSPLDKNCKNNARPSQPMNGRHVELYEEEPVGKKNHRHILESN